MKKSDDKSFDMIKEGKNFRIVPLAVMMVIMFIVLTVDDIIDAKGEERRIEYVKDTYQNEIDQLNEDHQKEINKLNEDLQMEIEMNYSTSEFAETYDLTKDQLILVSKCVDNYVDTFFRAYDRQHDYRYNYNSLCMLDEDGEVYAIYNLEKILNEDDEDDGPTEFLIFVSIDNPSTTIKAYEKLYIF